ncbi:MAG: hypothetical protein QXU18_01035 [Thermoplasmatales archaeon]
MKSSKADSLSNERKIMKGKINGNNTKPTSLFEKISDFLIEALRNNGG